jgi:hypothetical protein
MKRERDDGREREDDEGEVKLARKARGDPRIELPGMDARRGARAAQERRAEADAGDDPARRIHRVSSRGEVEGSFFGGRDIVGIGDEVRARCTWPSWGCPTRSLDRAGEEFAPGSRFPPTDWKTARPSWVRTKSSSS